MAEDPIAGFWRAFAHASGCDAPYDAWSFGDSPEQATELADLARRGVKRATASLAHWYDDEPPPRVGAYNVILDGSGHPVCIIRTTTVEVRPWAAVDDAFAAEEGEGDRSLSYWRSEHRRFFAAAGVMVDDATPIVLQRFRRVWPAN